jgi:flagellar basal body-associated protein FliL
MKKNVMIAVIVFLILTAGLMYFFQSSNLLEENGNDLPDNASSEPKKSEKLYDLKSSIGNIIDDSVQEDIQKAVEDEVRKTTEQKK